jgi:hypothetical protein
MPIASTAIDASLQHVSNIRRPSSALRDSGQVLAVRTACDTYTDCVPYSAGARKARRAKEDGVTRRSASIASQSSGSAPSVTASSRKQNAPSTHSTVKSGLGGWFGKKKAVQEITPLPTKRTSHPTKELMIELEPERPGPAPPTAPLDTQPPVCSRSLPYRSDHEPQTVQLQRFPLPPPLSPPPTGGLPQAPSPGMFSPGSLSGTYMVCIYSRQRGSHDVAIASDRRRPL